MVSSLFVPNKPRDNAAVNTTLLQYWVDVLRLTIIGGEWIYAVHIITQVLSQLETTSYAWLVIFNLFEIGKYTYMYAHEMPISKFREVVNLVHSYLESWIKSSARAQVDAVNYRIDATACRSAISGMFKEIGKFYMYFN